MPRRSHGLGMMLKSSSCENFWGPAREERMEDILREKVRSMLCLDNWVAAVTHVLLGSEKRGRHSHEEYADTCVEIVSTATKQLVEDIREFEAIVLGTG